MQRNIKKLVLLLIVGIVVILFLTVGRKDFVMDGKDISSITIRYKAQLLLWRMTIKFKNF
ncbi:MAG: hypothetical protein K0R05_2069 [Anaerocolumna sp.]|jgi:hypothetical protein|nr:hypothetical protein [Anaerocolumna sp.]